MCIISLTLGRLLFASYVFVVVTCSQIWEQELEFTGKKTIRITMSSNSTTETPSTSHVATEKGITGRGTNDGNATNNAPPSPFSDAFFNAIQQSNSSWQVSSYSIMYECR